MTIHPRWLRFARAAAVIVVLAVGTLIAWPEAPVQLLVPADGWQIEGGFAPTQPNKHGVPRSLRDHGEARFWRSWTPERGSQPGVLRSAPFPLGGVIGVPYNGFAGDPGLSTWLECVDSGARLPLATGRNNTVWSVVLIEPNADWCAGPARVLAISTTQTNYVALGTPYRVSWLSAFKQSPLAALWFVLASWALLAGLALFAAQAQARIPHTAPTAGADTLGLTRSAPSAGLNVGSATSSPVLSPLRAPSRRLDAIATDRCEKCGLGRLHGARVQIALLIAFGIVGYALFFAFWASVWLGRVATLALLLVSAIGWWRHRQRDVSRSPADLDSGNGGDALRQALRLWLLIASAVMSIALMVDDGSGAWSANGRFTPARWSSDNELPVRIGEQLVGGHVERSEWMGTWHVSDRPPLSYGWHANLRLLGNAVTLGNDGRHVSYLADWAAGVVLNTAWVPVIYLLLVTLGLRRHVAVLAVLCCALTPFFLFNSTYIWPKLLSAAFGLAAAAILLGLGSERRLRDDSPGLIAAAALSALALLTHGGSVFGVLAAIALAPCYRGLPSLRGALLAAVIGGSLLTPWVAWQHFVDPPGNALVKYAFAGTFGFGEESLGVLATIKRSFAALGWEDWAAGKWHGLQTLAIGTDDNCAMGEQGIATSLASPLRVADFLYAIPALRFLLVGLILVPALLRHNTISTRAPWRLTTFAMLSVTLAWLLSWDCHIIHHQSFQALAALYVGLILALLQRGGWALLALVCNAAYTLTVWVLEPLAHFPRFHPSAAIATIAILGLLVAQTWQLRACDAGREK